MISNILFGIALSFVSLTAYWCVYLIARAIKKEMEPWATSEIGSLFKETIGYVN
jgi:hypothetical protein